MVLYDVIGSDIIYNANRYSTVTVLYAVSWRTAKIHNDTVWYNTIWYDTIPYSRIWSSVIQYSTVRYGSTWYHTIQCYRIIWLGVIHNMNEYIIVGQTTLMQRYGTLWHDTITYNTISSDTMYQHTMVRYFYIQDDMMWYDRIQYTLG